MTRRGITANAPARSARSAPSTVVVALPHDAAAVATVQAEAERALGLFKQIETLDTYDEYGQADAWLTETARRKDAVVAMRKSATGPMYEAIRTIEGWFRPVVSALGEAEAHLKSVMGAFRLSIAEAEQAAREAAAEAADMGNAPALVEALTEAAALAERPPDARASCAFQWVVKRISPDMLPDEWWTPDTAKIEAFARRAKGDDAPVIPGVVFERVAQIGARR